MLSIADNADGVRDGFHFIEFVRNINAGDAVMLQVADDIQQDRSFLLSQRCGRFIEDQQAHLFVQRFGNFDQLLLP
ncbi:hypothetical protein D3C81_2057480 [compost metagenome]